MEIDYENYWKVEEFWGLVEELWGFVWDWGEEFGWEWWECGDLCIVRDWVEWWEVELKKIEEVMEV